MALFTGLCVGEHHLLILVADQLVIDISYHKRQQMFLDLDLVQIAFAIWMCVSGSRCVPIGLQGVLIHREVVLLDASGRLRAAY